MRNLPLLIALAIIVGLIFVSSYHRNQVEETDISIENFSTDKAVYHSEELMNLNAKIYSSSDLENVTVKMSGINGRLNEEKIVNLKKGMNNISFSYRLPRCNVCGGIRAGSYDLNCEVVYKNLTVERFVKVNIQQ